MFGKQNFELKKLENDSTKISNSIFSNHAENHADKPFLKFVYQ